MYLLQIFDQVLANVKRNCADEVSLADLCGEQIVELAEALKGCQSVRRIHVSFVDLRDEEICCVLGEGIEQNKSLTHFLLALQYFECPATSLPHLMNGLKKNTSITHVSVSFAGNEETTEVLLKHLGSCPKVLHLNMSHCEISQGRMETFFLASSSMHLVSLDVSWNELMDADIEIICRHFKSLQSLNVSSNAFGPMGAAALVSMLLSSSLTELDVSGNETMQCAGVLCLLNALRNDDSQLQALNLTKVFCLVEEECDQVWRALGVMLKCNRTLRILHVGQNKGDVRGMFDGLIQNDTLLELNLRELSHDGEMLAKVLMANKAIQKLDLTGSLFGDSGMKALCGAMECVTTLVLSGISFWKIGSESIAQMLKSNSTLTHLDLSYTCLNGQLLGDALRFNKSLKHLNLSNALMDCWDEVLEAVKLSQGLTHLNIMGSSLKGSLLGDVVEFNHVLKELDASNCVIDSYGWLCKALEKNDSLKTLTLCNRDISESAHAFQDMLKVNQSLTDVTIVSDMNAIGFDVVLEGLWWNGSIVRSSTYCPEADRIFARNKSLHERMRKLVSILLCIFRFRKQRYAILSKDIACLIAQHMWRCRTQLEED